MAKFKNKQDFKGSEAKTKIQYKGTPIRLSADFYTETLKARREWQYIFKVLKWKEIQHRTLPRKFRI